MTTCGVYVILHVASGRVYVGSSVAIERRWSTHRAELRRGRHHSSYLQRSWARHGSSAFHFAVVEECDPGDLEFREQSWIDINRACDPVRGYNIQPQARSTTGFRHGPDALEKMRTAARVRCGSPSHREMLAERARLQWAEGRIHPGVMTPERIENIRVGQAKSERSRNKFTHEVRERMSRAAKERHARERAEGSAPTSEEMARRTRMRKDRQENKSG